MISRLFRSPALVVLWTCTDVTNAITAAHTNNTNNTNDTKNTNGTSSTDHTNIGVLGLVYSFVFWGIGLQGSKEARTQGRKDARKETGSKEKQQGIKKNRKESS